MWPRVEIVDPGKLQPGTVIYADNVIRYQRDGNIESRGILTINRWVIELNEMGIVCAVDGWAYAKGIIVNPQLNILTHRIGEVRLVLELDKDRRAYIKARDPILARGATSGSVCVLLRDDVTMRFDHSAGLSFLVNDASELAGFQFELEK